LEKGHLGIKRDFGEVRGGGALGLGNYQGNSLKP